MKLTDRFVGALGVGIAGFFIWRATLIEEPFISDPVGPKIFPIIICLLLGLASLALVLRPDPEPEWPRLSGILEVVGGLVVFLAYTELLPVLGFVIATIFGAGYLSWRLGARPVAAAIAGLAIALGIYVIFHLALGLNLARGPLGF